MAADATAGASTPSGACSQSSASWVRQVGEAGRRSNEPWAVLASRSGCRDRREAPGSTRSLRGSPKAWPAGSNRRVKSALEAGSGMLRTRWRALERGHSSKEGVPALLIPRGFDEPAVHETPGGGPAGRAIARPSRLPRQGTPEADPHARRGRERRRREAQRRGSFDRGSNGLRGARPAVTPGSRSVEAGRWLR